MRRRGSRAGGGLRGGGAKWLYSPAANPLGQHWYTLVLAPGGAQALLYAWDGGPAAVPAGAQPVASLDPGVYADPTLLLDARAPLAAAASTLPAGVVPPASPPTRPRTTQFRARR